MTRRTRKRTKVLYVMLTDKEHDDYARKARESGMSMREWVTVSLSSAPVYITTIEVKR